MYRRFLVLFLGLLFALPAFAEERKERYPAPDFKNGYTLPKTQTPQLERDKWHNALDLMVLAGFLSVATHLIYTRRSRKATLVLTLAGLIYFGFYREGCVCPVGSIQNVAMSAGGNGYPLPWTLAVIFTLPLIFSLFYGRVFCSGVCPLGAIQDVVLFKAVKVPPWVEVPLGLFAFAYLGMGVLFAWTGSDFVICKYDPFVGLFRLSGPAHMIVLGGVILLLCVFVGRVYCRFICPYGVLLRLLSKFSRQAISITPRHCVDCRLCEESCPFGAIHAPLPVLNPNVEKEKKRIIAAVALTAVLMVGFAFTGYLLAPGVSRIDSRVVLADKVSHESQTGDPSLDDTVKAWRNTGETPSELYKRVGDVQHKFRIGLPIFGIWMGMSIGGRILGMLVKRRQTGYSADGSACVACARCYADCPIETGEAAS